MFVSRVKTEKYHNNYEGDCRKPIKDYYKKGIFKRSDRKRFLRNYFKTID